MTTTLFHIPLDQRALNKWAAQNSMTSRVGSDYGAVLHHLLAKLFEKGVLQPFRLFLPRAGSPAVYAYTQKDAQELIETARIVAPPDVLDVVQLNQLRSRPMPDSFKAGQRLGFDVRIRPVIRGKTEKDAFLWEAEKDHADDLEGMIRAGRSRQTVYADWLQSRLNAIAEIEYAELAHFERTRAIRNGRPVEGPDATMHGTLTVIDPGKFGEKLANGVGRHRAFGYGMLLLRPPGQAAYER